MEIDESEQKWEKVQCFDKNEIRSAVVPQFLLRFRKEYPIDEIGDYLLCEKHDHATYYIGAQQPMGRQLVQEGVETVLGIGKHGQSAHEGHDEDDEYAGLHLVSCFYGKEACMFARGCKEILGLLPQLLPCLVEGEDQNGHTDDEAEGYHIVAPKLIGQGLCTLAPGAIGKFRM